MLKLTYFKDINGEYRFHFMRKGKILMQGEGYKKKSNMTKMLRLFCNDIGDCIYHIEDNTLIKNKKKS